MMVDKRLDTSDNADRFCPGRVTALGLRQLTMFNDIQCSSHGVCALCDSLLTLGLEQTMVDKKPSC